MNRRRLLKVLGQGTALLPLWSVLGRAAPAPATLKFSELYGRVTVRGAEFSDKLRALQGQQVRMSGFMAPPLKPKLDFFVLTREPMSTCPFCTTAADWPADIVLVIMPPGRELDPTVRGLSVTGRLDSGVRRDAETGFVSLVRLYAEQVSTQA